MLLLAALAPPGAHAQPHRADRHPEHARPAPVPHSIGKFEDWQSATHDEGGQTTCYAFVRAASSSPQLPGRGDVVLTVTDRPGTQRDAVAISMGYALPPAATVTMQVEAARVAFYTDNKRNAFARDGHAAIAALGHGSRAVVHASGPRAAEVTDSFSLRGFTAAYAAVARACPPRP